MTVRADHLAQRLTGRFALGQAPLFEQSAVAVRPLGIGVPSEPLRCGRGEAVQRRAQRLAHALQPVHCTHRGQHVRAVRTLAPAGLEQAELAEPRQHGVEQCLFEPARDQAGSELAQDRVVEPSIGQVEAEGVFPVDPTPDGIGCLSIGQPLGELQHGDERQAPGRVSRLAASRVERNEHLVVVDRAQLVAHAHGRTALPKRRCRDLSSCSGNGFDLRRMQRHDGSPWLTLRKIGQHGAGDFANGIRSQRKSTVEFDREDARQAGEVGAALAASGTPIGPYDVLIAGQARARDLVLVTHNVGEFSRVDGLRVED